MEYNHNYDGNCENLQTNDSNTLKSDTVHQVEHKKLPLYKRWWFWLIATIIAITIISSCFLLLLATLIGFSNNNSNETNDSNDESNSDNFSNKDNQDIVDTQNHANLGTYNVVIDSCRLAEDWTGNPIIIVKYVFTNYSEYPASFWLSIEDNVFQDGIGLNECYLPDESANYSSDNQTKEIKKSATIEVEVAYTLNNTTAPVEVEVSRNSFIHNTTITKTFYFN